MWRQPARSPVSSPALGVARGGDGAARHRSARGLCPRDLPDKARDPGMHQTKKGKQWYFGMKAHFGVDSRTKLIHSVMATPANVADSAVLPDLLHGRETRVWGDQAYRVNDKLSSIR